MTVDREILYNIGKPPRSREINIIEIIHILEDTLKHKLRRPRNDSDYVNVMRSRTDDGYARVYVIVYARFAFKSRIEILDINVKLSFNIHVSLIERVIDLIGCEFLLHYPVGSIRSVFVVQAIDPYGITGKLLVWQSGIDCVSEQKKLFEIRHLGFVLAGSAVA